MKKMISILIACLTLIWVPNAFADYADGLGQDLIESIAALYDQYGDYKTWPAEGYQTAASILCEANIISEANLLAVIDQTSDTMGDRLINLLPGTSSKLIKRVAISMWGDENFWSLEQAYEYTETLRNHGLLLETDRVYMLPDENTVSIETIKQNALSYIKTNYNLDLSLLDGIQFFCTYSAQKADEQPQWKLVFGRQAENEIVSTILMNRNGEIADVILYNPIKDMQRYQELRPESGYIFELSLEEQKEFGETFTIPIYGLPDASHIDAEEAKRLAQIALESKEIYFSPDEINVYLSFVVTDIDKGSYPYWMINYTDKKNNLLQYTVRISAQNGDLLDIQIQDWNIPGKG